MKYYDLIKSPIVTEVTNKLIERQNKYTFKVAKTANKIEIKKAFEHIFKVKVTVNTSNVLPRFKRKGKYAGYTAGYKKAVVKVTSGEKIAILAND
ncbi:50S ribosomal protein L23 [Candidatus Phytoplasma australiense]|uniref:Large ribosomal subunit protein uL23 n=2 Tax=Phytoplasma australiense TaxID=59748 RepID=RL23_PHYAS|nr:50S ribosomal protein L23 [Candidatus Phytoplasma australiense]B1VAE6.1 RecName: Full=Large ribosomal subunit protein uL23; AltName: Full=50S ribosomal protein L23 [Candidatus Phytoplasma australiense]AGL90306.1 50S ribosomal protein L23 [Strawberry lethal yellows phytoplasma (CPA) str. NZSb11]CAM11919.1 50S ribosomal protein L23 [Candidatus Phytoplasma australiense]